MRASRSRLEGETAAALARRAAAGDSRALAALPEHLSRAGDPDFAKALLLGLGAKGVIEFPASLATRLRGELNGGDPERPSADGSRIVSVMKMLGKALAAGTQRPDTGADAAFLHRLQAEGRAGHRFPGGGFYKGYQSLSTLLGMGDGQPPPSREFMGTVGRDMIAYDRTEAAWRNPESAPGTSAAAEPLPDLAGLLDLGRVLGTDTVVPPRPPGSSGDFLEGLLYAARFSGAAARELLRGNLTYLLHERPVRPAMAPAVPGQDEESGGLLADDRK